MAWLGWVGVGLTRASLVDGKINVALEWWLIVTNIGVITCSNIPLSSDAVAT